MANEKNRCGTRVLPVARLDDAGYFIDLRLRQFRETMNPGSYVDFDSVKGREMCLQAGVVTCLGCGLSVIVSAFDGEGSRCMRCGGVIGLGGGRVALKPKQKGYAGNFELGTRSW